MGSVIFEHRDGVLTVYIVYAHTPFSAQLRSCANRTSTRVYESRENAKFEH